MGLYCFINKEDKRLYITWSIDLLRSVTRHIGMLCSGVHNYRNMQLDCNKLEFEFIETIEDDRSDISLKYQYWVEYYKELGYTLYAENQVSKYKVVIKIKKSLVYVTLKSTYYTNIVVGVFNNMPEAEEFASIINNLKIISPIYAINDLSKKFFKNLI